MPLIFAILTTLKQAKDCELLWDKTTSNGFNDKYISSVVYSENSLAVFSNGDF